MNQEEAPPNDLSPDAYVLSEVVKPLMQSFNEILELYSDIKRKYAEHCKDCENHQKSDVKANLDLETSVIAEVAPSDNFMKITDFNKLKAQLTRIMGHMKQLDDEYQSGKEQNEQAILQLQNENNLLRNELQLAKQARYIGSLMYSPEIASSSNQGFQSTFIESNQNYVNQSLSPGPQSNTILSE